MILRLKKIVGGWAVLFGFGVYGMALAQLGGTNIDGIQIDVAAMFRMGDAKDLDCQVRLEFSGENILRSENAYPVRIFRAVDDTGVNLIRTNSQRNEWISSLRDGHALTTISLKAPVVYAHKLAQLEGEVELMVRTTNTETITNLLQPAALKKIRFNLENIRLPWWEPGELEVTASEAVKLEVKNTNTYACEVLLTFRGGEVGKSMGIRKVSVTKAETEAGQSFKFSESHRSIMNRFSSLGDSGAGRCVQLRLPLETDAANPRKIINLEGEAEVYCPSPTNGGEVVFNGFIKQPGQTFQNEALTRCGVKLFFVGWDNFAVRQKDWHSRFVTIYSGNTRSHPPEKVADSLYFLVENPQNRIIRIEFLDEKGQWQPTSVMIGNESLKATTDHQLYIFDKPPPDETQLRIYLATPESLNHVKFKIQDIPL